VAASKKEDVELPFDDDEVAPLQEDDPRPQRVPQFPAGPRRKARGGYRDTREVTKDRELVTRFDSNEYSDPGFVPAYLYVEKGPGAGQLIPVKQGPLVIGRASACELRLQHPSISRRHAQLIRQGERFTLRDLGSQNGTFVNRVKITGDKEIRLGDEISLGNALLKLRGQGVGTTEQVAAQPPTPARQSKRERMSLPRTAIVATAVGSAAAVLLTVALVKLSDPAPSATLSTENAAPSTPPDAQQAESPPALATESPAQPDRVDAPAQPPAQEEEKVQAAPEPREESPAALAVVAPPEEAPAQPEPKASNPRDSDPGVKATSSRKEPGARSGIKNTRRPEASSEPSRPPEKAPVAPATATVDRADILALYEKGEIEVALTLARGGPHAPLAKQIATYQSAMAAGQKALSARDNAGAIKHLSAALAVDQELSQGWSVQGRKLRQQLGRLYTRAGQDQVKAGALDAARESFTTALKFDPTNTWAKSELQALGGKP
jgi:pSer/pThr/pTyr-binding forkhead associated (FHA) protein